MFKTMQNAWKIPDLRKKILFTLLVIIVFRIGANMPAPFLNMEALAGLMGFVTDSSSANAFAYLNTLSGGAFAQATLFAMSVTPYINSSIIMQLLTVAIPPLERMAKEGEEGRKKIGAITRYVAVVLGLVQGLAYYLYLRGSSYEGTPIVTYTEGAAGVFTAIVIVLVFTAGTAMMMWLGEQINQKGIGNGISILLFAGIVARLPDTVNILVKALGAAWESPDSFVLFLRTAVRHHLPGHYLGHRIHERRGEKNPGAVRETGCRQKDVRRPVHPSSHQGQYVRRYADHLRKLYFNHSIHHPAVCNSDRLLENRVGRSFHHRLGVRVNLLPADFDVRLFLCGDSV